MDGMDDLGNIKNKKLLVPIRKKTPFFFEEKSLQADAETTLDHAIRVMSFNVRSDDDPDHLWARRRGWVVSMMRFHHPDLIGLQEPDSDQIADLSIALKDYGIFKGICLQDKEMGSHDPILYRKSRFTLLDSGFFFLSDTPEVPGLGWDAKFPRGVCWVKLKDKRTLKVFYFFNTHFDYHGRHARDESALLLREKISAISGKCPFIVAGDFNLFPDLGGEKTYEILTQKQLHKEGRPLIDAHKVCHFPHHGPTGSWSGFKEAGQPGIKPDYIFVDHYIEVLTHGILADTFDGQFPSDHLPVVADLAFHL